MSTIVFVVKGNVVSLMEGILAGEGEGDGSAVP